MTELGKDPAVEAVELEQEIIGQLNAGALQLLDGLKVSDDAAPQLAVTFRELSAGDLIDAQVAAEKVVSTPQGPQLVTSPSLMGLEMLRRKIAFVGDIPGPLSMMLLRKLSERDLQRLSIATELRDLAQAAAMSADRGRVVAVSE